MNLTWLISNHHKYVILISVRLDFLIHWKLHSFQTYCVPSIALKARKSVLSLSIWQSQTCRDFILVVDNKLINGKGYFRKCSGLWRKQSGDVINSVLLEGLRLGGYQMHEICMKRQPTMRRSVGRRFQAAGIIKKLKKKKKEQKLEGRTKFGMVEERRLVWIREKHTL